MAINLAVAELIRSSERPLRFGAPAAPSPPPARRPPATPELGRVLDARA